MKSTYSISARGIALIKQFEGFSATPYLCPAGKWTVGYGHVIPAAIRHGEVTEAMADTMLQSDLVPVEAAINRLIGVSLSQSQFDALCSLVYNIGISAFGRSTLLKMLNNREEGAAKQFLRWIYTGKQPLPGLKNRRQAEMELFMNQ